MDSMDALSLEIVRDERPQLLQLRRSRIAFQAMVLLFVVVASFLYGIAIGVRRHKALATLTPPPSPIELAFAQRSSLDLPSGVSVTPLGDKIEVNGRAADVVMFSSDRSVQDLVGDEVRLWKSHGFLAGGQSGARRGVGVAFDKETAKRYSITVWTVPPAFRDASSTAAPVQGIVASSPIGGTLPNSPEEGAGMIPDVPLPAGGHAGSMFSSVGFGGRSFTGVYTNPGSVAENVEYYRNVMLGRSWSEASATLESDAGKGVGSLRFVKGDRELVLLFAPVKDSVTPRAGKATLVSVSLGPDVIKMNGGER